MDAEAVTAQELFEAGEIGLEFFRASGPGGQHVNKVATAVRLRFVPAESQLLPEAVKARLIEQTAGRITREGALLIEAKRSRKQERNRQEALKRLSELIERAWRPPRRRKKTKPSRAAREKRLQEKRRRSQVKKNRSRVVGPDD